MAKFASEFQEYLGISNVTITDGITPVITAAIPEFNPIEEKQLGEKIIYKACTEDAIGGTGGCANVAKVKTVICTFFGCGNTNGLIPCVHRGERVRVFNYAGTEQYYWRAYGKDPGLRKHERVRWFAMDKGEPSVDQPPAYQNVTDFNNYHIELNTNPGEKCIRIHTGVSDGEELAYDICIYPEACCLEITDNMSGGGDNCKPGVHEAVQPQTKEKGEKHGEDGSSSNNGRADCICTKDGGNCIRLESKKHWWHIRNIDDSIIDVKMENITLTCKDTITLDAGKHIITKCGEQYHSTVGTFRVENVGTQMKTFCPQQDRCTEGTNLGELTRLNATVNDDSATAIVPLPTNSSCNQGSYELMNNLLIDQHCVYRTHRTAKVMGDEASLSHSTVSKNIVEHASGLLSLTGDVNTAIFGDNTSITGSTIAYTGSHTFGGPSFVVQTASGIVNGLTIVFGANFW